jgi:2-(1,2-epoxy-1,2-dihydrophenyl)acetyl-CoA isomerase
MSRLCCSSAGLDFAIEQERENAVPEFYCTVTDGVMRLVINRPAAMNALSRDIMEGLLESLEAASKDPGIGCVVVSGVGTKAFCAGGDVKSMAAGSLRDGWSAEQKILDLRARMRITELLHEMPKPTIAMVNGVAAGAGLSIALAADMRFAGKSARMTTAFAKIGYSGDFGCHYFLHRLVGPAKARELYFTSEVLGIEAIEKLGLANRIFNDDELEAETMAFGKVLAAGPRLAWWHAKRNMKAAEEGTLAEALDREAVGMIMTAQTDDHKDAAKAFAEKRQITFKGR